MRGMKKKESAERELSSPFLPSIYLVKIHRIIHKRARTDGSHNKMSLGCWDTMMSRGQILGNQTEKRTAAATMKRMK
jgi:hypothetical protein